MTIYTRTITDQVTATTNVEGNEIALVDGRGSVTVETGNAFSYAGDNILFEILGSVSAIKGRIRRFRQ